MKGYTLILLALMMAACTTSQSASLRKGGDAANTNAPMTITYEGETEITFGVIGDITIYVRPERDAQSLSMTITPGARLEVIYGELHQDFGPVSAGQEVSMKVRYMAPEEGLYNLNVTATGSFSGSRMSTSAEVQIMIYAPISPFRDAG